MCIFRAFFFISYFIKYYLIIISFFHTFIEILHLLILPAFITFSDIKI
jgi:hypothetical protein